MFAYQFITNHFPSLHLSDKVSLALQFMDDFEVQHLPVLAEEKFMGMVAKDDLLDLNESSNLEEVEALMIRKAVKGSEHFFAALKLASVHTLSVVPVVNEAQELLGSIIGGALIQASASFLGTEEVGALIVLEMDKKSYSFGEIIRLVETNDAFITQLNTSFEAETGLLLVTIKVNKLAISDIIATFQRYEYIIRYFIGEEDYENEIRFNYDHLMSYLKM
jgi:predicted transcriptional regulator